ncbi:Signal recognition particle subunit SRP72 [Rhizina undulata]
MSEFSPEALEFLKNLSVSDAEPDHEQILKHANILLQSNNTHHRALSIKLVALLHLDRFEDALRVLDSPEGRQQLGNTTKLERAYSLYKLGRVQEAADVAASVDDTERHKKGLKHIEAQAAYRLEEFERAARIYKSLTDNPDVDFEADIKINAGAANAQLIWSGRAELAENRKPTNEDLDVFEQAYNAACASIARNETTQALILLKRAKDLCNFVEFSSEEDKFSELAPILAQQAYVLSRLGRHKEALELCKELNSQNLSDESLKVIATNNELAISSYLPEYNPHLALLTSERVPDTTRGPSRPFQFQSRVLDRNKIVLDLDVGKTEAVKKESKKYHEAYPHDTFIGVINAAAHVGSKSGTEATKKVEALFAASPKDIGLALTLVQLRMSAGNITGGIEVLEKLLESLDDNATYQPGLIGLLVALYQHQGRKKHVRDVLSKASDWWKNSDKPNLSILRASGAAKLSSDSPSDLRSAGDLFTSILSSNPTDKFALAGVVASYATIEPSLTSPHIDKLTPVETLISGIDASALESLGVAQPPRKRSAEDSVVPQNKPRKVRKRKIRLPKDYDPERKPDPERWLPLRDRSSYRPKGRKDKKKAAQATQGGAVEESMELAGGGRVDVVKVEGKKPGGGGGGPAKNKNKKKKGGLKW